MELYPGAEFHPGWHIELIASLVAEARSRPLRLIINIPPRHLKSLICSVALPAWLLGHNPSLHIICVSYGSELSNKLSRDFRCILESSWYQRLFPTRLDRCAVDELTTTAHGSRLATSIGGRTTGLGADVIIRHPDHALCPVRALEGWLHASGCRYGPVFRKVDRWGNVEHARLGTDAIRRIWERRSADASGRRGQDAEGSATDSLAVRAAW